MSDKFKLNAKFSILFFMPIIIVSCDSNRTLSKINMTTPQLKTNVIYGEDNRHDYYEINDSEVQLIAHSTVALISKENLNYDNIFDKYNFEKPEFSLKMCNTEKFRDQPTWAFCSGSLIAPDLILTAGHCIPDSKTCRETQIVFDYTKTQKNTRLESVAGKNVFDCAEVIYSTAVKNAADFAIIRLNRSVDRPILEFANADVELQTQLMLIGHPAGYPTKITTNGHVRDLSNEFYFRASMDAFSGNSGSAVFDQVSHKIVGVLARGENDYEKSNSCYIAKVCAEENCRGEDVTRISEIRKFLPKN